MKKWSALLFGCFFALLVFAGCKGEEQLTVYYVHDNPCGSCHPFEEFTEWFQKEAVPESQREKIQYRELNLFQRGGQEGFAQLCQKLGIPQEEQNPPMLIIGQEYIRGEEAIRSGGAALLQRQIE